MKLSHLILCGALAVAGGLVACKQSQPDSSGDESAEAPQNGGHSHDDAEVEGHHGPSLPLGTSDIGPFSVRAARDEGEITPGGDAPIDVWVEADHESVVAVRFWIGTEDASGSIKARAAIENPDTPNHWHTHAMVPDLMPEGAMLWVEIETADGRHTGSFDLHMGHTH